VIPYSNQTRQPSDHSTLATNHNPGAYAPLGPPAPILPKNAQGSGALKLSAEGVPRRARPLCRLCRDPARGLLQSQPLRQPGQAKCQRHLHRWCLSWLSIDHPKQKASIGMQRNESPNGVYRGYPSTTPNRKQASDRQHHPTAIETLMPFSVV
jgi:hypothetical protein